MVIKRNKLLTIEVSRLRTEKKKKKNYICRNKKNIVLSMYIKIMICHKYVYKNQSTLNILIDIMQTGSLC